MKKLTFLFVLLVSCTCSYSQTMTFVDQLSDQKFNSITMAFDKLRKQSVYVYNSDKLQAPEILTYVKDTLANDIKGMKFKRPNSKYLYSFFSQDKLGNPSMVLFDPSNKETIQLNIEGVLYVKRYLNQQPKASSDLNVVQLLEIFKYFIL